MYIVYLVTKTDGLSGGHRVIFEHANRLQKRNHKVEIWSIEPVSPTWFPCEVPLYSFQDVNVSEADVLVITDPVFIPDFLKRIPAKKYFFLAQHDLELIQEIDGNKDYAKALKTLFGRDWPPACRIISVSSWVKDRLYEQYRLNSFLVRNGIDQNLFHQTKPLIAKTNPEVLFFYAPQIWKGADWAFCAVSETREFMPETEAMVVSTFMPDWPRENGMFWRLLWPVTYFFFPAQKKLAGIYSSADVFVSSSRYEGFGLPGLEAMACGVPVVTTDSGGVREYAIPEETAIVVPSQKPGALAEGILRVLNDKPLRERLIKNGLEKAKEFDWEKSVDILERVLLK